MLNDDHYMKQFFGGDMLVPSKPTAEEKLMYALEASKNVAATITGMKKQYTENGWSEQAAEKLVIQLLKIQNNKDDKEENNE